MDRRTFLKSFALGSGVAAVGGLEACIQQSERRPLWDTQTLPNGALVPGKIEKSRKYPHHYNLVSPDPDAVAKSYLTGTIKSVKFAHVSEVPSPLQAENPEIPNTGVYIQISPDLVDSTVEEGSDYHIFIGIEPRSKDYSGPMADELSNDPLRILEKALVGDKIRIPTLRKYDYPHRLYKIMNQADEYKVSEIKLLSHALIHDGMG
ncbi:hypothetical protein J4227_04510 [Candidatus Woesearchaeota archaeon]|nr:hypothetical protein [Candidatus Woesearchaeota archaeon]